MSGSRMASSASKSPPRVAARKASTTSRWRLTSTEDTSAPRTRRRARLASWRAASGERPTISPISVKGTSKMSCKHEGDPLGRAQSLEHDQQRRPDRIGQQHLVLGASLVGTVRAWFGRVHPHGVFSARLAGAQRVQAHPGHHGGEPPADVLDAARVRAAETQPGLLYGVVGRARRAEHAVGDRPQVPPVGLEPFGHPVVLGHGSVSLVVGHHKSDGSDPPRCDRAGPNGLRGPDRGSQWPRTSRSHSLASPTSYYGRDTPGRCDPRHQE